MPLLHSNSLKREKNWIKGGTWFDKIIPKSLSIKFPKVFITMLVRKEDVLVLKLSSIIIMIKLFTENFSPHIMNVFSFDVIFLIYNA